MMHDAPTATHECCCFALLILNAFLCFRHWQYVSELIRRESARDDYHVSQTIRPVRSSRPRSPKKSPSSPIVSPFRDADAQEARQTLPSADRGKERQRTNESHDAGIVCGSLQTQMWRRKANSDSPASCSNLATSPRRFLKSSSHAAKSESDLYDSHSHAQASQSSPVCVENVCIEDQVEENLNNAARENELANDVSSRSEQMSPFNSNSSSFNSNSSSFNSNSSLGGTSGSSKRVSSGSRYTAQLLRRRGSSGSLSPSAKNLFKL